MERAALLVVEDSEAAYHQVRKAAEQLGLQTEWALNGAEALRLCRLHRYTAIVLDLYLPLLDGMSFLRILRAEGDESTPVVVISGSALEREVERAMGLGAKAFVQKPIEADRFSVLLRGILEP